MDYLLTVQPSAGVRHALVCGLALMLLGCSQTTSPAPRLTTADAATGAGNPSEHRAIVRVVNASPTLGALALQADGSPISATVAPLTASGTTSVPAAAGLTLAAVDGGSHEVFAPNGAWQTGEHYTIVAMQRADAGLSARTLVDPPDPPRGLRRLRVLNAMTVDAVGLAVAESEVDATETRLASGLAPWDASGAVDVSSTAADVRLLAGDRFFRCTLGEALGARVLLVPTHTADGQPALLAVDELAATSLDCIEPEPHAAVRVVHAATGEDRLAVAFGGDPIATVSFGGSSNYATVRANEDTELVATRPPAAAGRAGTTALTRTTRFEAGSKSTLIAVTTAEAADNVGLALIQLDDLTDECWLVNGLGEPVTFEPELAPAGARLIPPGPLVVAVSAGRFVCDVPTTARHVVLLPNDGGVSMLIDSPGEASVQAGCTREKVPTSYVELLSAAAVGALDVTLDGATEPLVTALPALTATTALPFPTGTPSLRVSAADAPAIDAPVGSAKEGDTLRLFVGRQANTLFAKTFPKLSAADRIDLRLIDATAAEAASGPGPALQLWAELSEGDGAAPSWTRVGTFDTGEPAPFDVLTIARLGLSPVGTEDGPTLVCDGSALSGHQAADIVLVSATESADAASLALWSDALVVAACAPLAPPPLSEVRVVVAARLSGPVTITAGDVVRTLSFGEASAYADAPSESFSASASSDGADITYGPVSLDPDARYTLALVGNAAGIGTLLLADAAQVTPELGALRLVNAAAGSGPLTLALLTSTGSVPIADALAFGSVAPELNVNPGPVELELGVPGNGAVRCVIPSVEAGSFTEALVATTPEGARALIVLRDGSPASTILCAPPIDGVVHVMNASTTSATISVDGQPTGAQVGPLTPLTLGLAKGSHAVTLTPTQGGVAASATVEVSVASQTTLVGVGTPLSALSLAHGVAAIGATRVRVISALDGPAVSVSIRSADGADKPLGSLAVGVASPATTTPAGALTLAVDVDGNGTTDLDCPISASSGDSVHVVLVRQDGDIALWTDLRGAEPVFTTCNAPAPTPAAVHVVHLAPAAASVDLFAGGSLVASGLVYTKSTQPLSVLPSTALVALVSPSGAPLASLSPGTLTAGASVTVALYGSPAVMAAFPDTTALPAAGAVRYRVINASGAGPFSALSLSGLPVPLATNLAPGHATAYLAAAAGPLTLGVDLNDDGVADRSCGTALGADQTYNVFVFGDTTAVALCVESGGVTALVACKPVD